jgi:prepilin-type N-terminal cleavage/methylation domain-containing protein
MSRQNDYKKAHFQAYQKYYIQHQNKAQGFTLIELLLALGLMAILALLAYRGLDSVLRLHQGAYTHQQQAQAIDRTLTQLEADARQASSVVLLSSTATPASGISNAGLHLQIKRRIGNESVIIEWTLENKHLLRRTNAEAKPNAPIVNPAVSTTVQTADLLGSIDTIEWLEWNIENSIWNVVPLTKVQIQAQPNEQKGQLPLTNALGLRLTITGKTLEKHFLIGR